MKFIFFVILLFTFSSQAKNFEILAAGQFSSITSSSLTGLLHRAAYSDRSIKILGEQRGLVLYKRGHFVLFDKYQPPKAKELNKDLRRSLRSLKRVAAFESARSILLFSPNTPKELKGSLLRTMQSEEAASSTWNNIDVSTAKIGRLKEMDHVLVEIPGHSKMRNSEWRTTSFDVMHVEMNGQKTKIYILSKEFGSSPRMYREVVRRKKKSKDLLLLGTGDFRGISARGLHFLSKEKFGFDVLAGAGSSVVAYKNIIEPAPKELGVPTFVSANIYRGDKPLFKEFVVMERGGAKIAITAVSPLVEKNIIENHLAEKPWLKEVSVEDPESKLEKVVEKMQARADFIVVLATSEKNLDRYKHILGIDLLIHPGEHEFAGNVEQKIELEPFRKRFPVYPIIKMGTSPAHLVSFKASIKSDKLYATYKKDILDHSYDAEEEIEAEDTDYVQMHEGELKNPVLPPYQEAFTNGSQGKITKSEFAVLAAELLRRGTRAEVGLFNVQNRTAMSSGTIDASMIRAWVRRHEKLITFLIKGAELKSLVSRQGSMKDPYKYRVAGIQDSKINGVAIQDSELYKVVASTAFINQIKKYPELQKRKRLRKLFAKEGEYYVDSKEGQPKAVVDVLIDLMKKNWQDQEELPLADRMRNFRDLLNGKVTKIDSYWVHDFKSIRLEYSKLDTTDVSAFSDVNDSRLQSTEQESLGGLFEYSAFLRSDPFILELGTVGKFTKVKIFEDTGTTENTTEDDLLFFSTIGFPVFDINIGKIWADKMGPFVEINYDTEFEQEDGQPKEKIVRGLFGWKLFDGQYLKSLSLSAFNENDLTEGREKNEWGLGLKFDWKMPLLGDRANWRSVADLKYFFDTDADAASDLRTRFVWDNFVDFRLAGNLWIGPYFKYFTFSAKTFDKTGTQTVVGLSLSYNGQWKPAFQPIDW